MAKVGWHMFGGYKRYLTYIGLLYMEVYWGNEILLFVSELNFIDVFMCHKTCIYKITVAQCTCVSLHPVYICDNSCHMLSNVIQF